MYNISKKSRKRLSRAHALLKKVAEAEVSNYDARCSYIYINGAREDLEHINIYS